MKKTLAIAALLGIITGLLFVGMDKTFSASLAQQSSFGSLEADGVNLTQTFTPVSSGFAKYVLSKIQLDAGLTGTSTVYIYQDDVPAGGLSNLLSVSTTSFTNSGAINQAFNTTTTLSGSGIWLEAGTTYTLVSKIQSITTNPPKRYQATTNNAYFAGQGFFCGSDETCSGTTTALFGSNTGFWGSEGSPNHDFYFDITDANGSSVITNYDTFPNILIPTNGTTIPDFSAWSIDVSNPTSTVSGTAFVRYSQSTSTWQHSDAVSYAPFVSSNPLSIPKRQSLYNFQNSTSSVWYAQPVLQGSWGTIFGNVISFTINAPLEGEQAPPQSFRGCFDQSASFFSSSTIKGIACIFFVPGESSTGFMANAYESFQNVFPFSLFFAIADTIESELDTATQSTLSLTAPSGNGLITVPILSTSTLTALIGTTVTNTIHNFLLTVVILAFTATLVLSIFSRKRKGSMRKT